MFDYIDQVIVYRLDNFLIVQKHEKYLANKAKNNDTDNSL